MIPIRSFPWYGHLAKNKYCTSGYANDLMKQGVPWVVRKVLQYANLSLEIQQASSLPDGTTTEFRVDDSGLDSPAGAITILRIKQTVNPGGFDSEGIYHLDGKLQAFSLPIFGDVKMKLQYINVADVPNEPLRQRLDKANPSSIVIGEVAHNRARGWEASVVWAFELVDGQRYLTRNIFTSKDKQKVEARMVYDYHA